MTIVLALIAVACITLIVWAAPGVWAQHRQDVFARRWERMVEYAKFDFALMSRTMQEAADTFERLSDLLNQTPVGAE